MISLHPESLRDLLEHKYLQYNKPEFIENDPVSVPHLFTDLTDIEIAGFFSAMIAWGNRKTIVRNALKLVGSMDHAPYDFVMHAQGHDLKAISSFVHRTFNGEDVIFLIACLRAFYNKYGSMRHFFLLQAKAGISLREMLIQFRQALLLHTGHCHAYKHIPDMAKNTAAKRLNMFLRWMVRKDSHGVDFGIWQPFPASVLMIPLDVHTSRVAGKLGLLQIRNSNWKAVEQLTQNLRYFDPADPVKYDFALFGMGIYEGM